MLLELPAETAGLYDEPGEWLVRHRDQLRICCANGLSEFRRDPVLNPLTPNKAKTQDPVNA